MKLFHKISSGWRLAHEARGQLEKSPDLWDRHPFRTSDPNNPFHGTSDIWVRYNDAAPYLALNDFTGFNGPHVPINYPAWYRLPAVRDICFLLMTMVRGEMLGGVLITRVPPGGGVRPHEDIGWHVDTMSKFFIPLTAAPGMLFGASDEDHVEEACPEVGDVVYFDNRRTHWVVNRSEIDRITLIVCIRSEAFMLAHGQETHSPYFPG